MDQAIGDRTLKGASLVLAALGAIVYQGAMGCGVAVEIANPRPNIDLKESHQVLNLRLSSKIPNDFDMPTINLMYTPHVSGWRSSLKRGFRNGFGEYFDLSPDARPDLVLEITEALPEIVMTQNATGYTAGGVYHSTGQAAGNAQIRYRARLLDAQGRVLKKSFGTVPSKRTFTNIFEGTAVVESAVETLYEAVARDCFRMDQQAAEGDDQSQAPNHGTSGSRRSVETRPSPESID